MRARFQSYNDIIPLSPVSGASGTTEDTTLAAWIWQRRGVPWNILQSEDLLGATLTEIRWPVQRSTPGLHQTSWRERLQISEGINVRPDSVNMLCVRECVATPSRKQQILMTGNKCRWKRERQGRYLLEPVSRHLHCHSGTIWRKPEAPGVKKQVEKKIATCHCEVKRSDTALLRHVDKGGENIQS